MEKLPEGMEEAQGRIEHEASADQKVLLVFRNPNPSSVDFFWLSRSEEVPLRRKKRKRRKKGKESNSM